MTELSDGKRRSERRQRQKAISLRVTLSEKARFAQKAERAGHKSVGAYMRDLLEHHGLCARPLRVISGQLAQHGAALTQTAEVMAAQGHKDLAAELEKLSAETATLQHQIFEGLRDDRQSDR